MYYIRCDDKNCQITTRPPEVDSETGELERISIFETLETAKEQQLKFFNIDRLCLLDAAREIINPRWFDEKLEYFVPFHDYMNESLVDVEEYREQIMEEIPET